MVKVIICGVCKNVGNYLDNSIKAATKIGENFEDYKIVLYENNSTDNTKQVLSKYINNDKFKILMEDFSDEYIKKNSKIWSYKEITGSDHSCRLEQITNARNKLVEEINKHDYNDFDVIVMIDLDHDDWNIKGVVDAINRVYMNKKLVFYGKTTSYYDYFALRSLHNIHSILGPELIGEDWWTNLKNKFLRFRNSDLIEVYSAFNSIGVYSKDILRHTKYSCLYNDTVKSVYLNILDNNQHIRDAYQSKIENDCTKFPGGIYDKDLNGYWKNNSGFNKPVMCEHVCFNFELISKGYKIYIDTKI